MFYTVESTVQCVVAKYQRHFRNIQCCSVNTRCIIAAATVEAPALGQNLTTTLLDNLHPRISLMVSAVESIRDADDQGPSVGGVYDPCNWAPLKVSS